MYVSYLSIYELLLREIVFYKLTYVNKINFKNYSDSFHRNRKIYFHIYRIIEYHT